MEAERVVGEAGQAGVSVAALRRRRCDAAHRAAGRVRLGFWVPAVVAAEADELMKVWGLEDRTDAFAVAVRHLAKRTRDGLQEIDV